MANIKQIARLAGVSVTTVSRVLNDHPYVAEEKRIAVWDAIRKLDYTPNLNAVNLATGRTQMVAVLLPFANHPFFAGMIEGIAYEALQRKYRIVICQTDYKPEEERSALESLRRKQVDGMIICSKQLGWSDIEGYAADGPIVACEYTDSSHISSLYVDHYATTTHAMQTLIAQGHRRIGYVLGRPDSFNSVNRLRAYKDCLTEIGQAVHPAWIFHHCYQVDQGADVVKLIANMNERPTALLVAGDQSAAGIIIEARKQGMDVPSELSVIGFDNIPLAEVLDITTYNLSSFEFGCLAFSTFFRQLTTKGQPPEKHQFPVQLIERATVAKIR
ncbi:LacI family DNA-binding transcriptional regulator [Paenibacillus sp. 481]|uniref:LacI family DNA-binding transcriptional regulator n=1 Tax=Paenibacillus sp. 481 TaxID=2835869 RepID=UPI001E4D146B|nr:LacI family DNA-binding transcriptional regulator [Paenibacillus sp. 481]UHA72369.1 LacI family DNA-binding transcriptional regulator [Paenibacillus sp. 481]